jgi:hypothetical protein
MYKLVRTPHVKKKKKKLDYEILCRGPRSKSGSGTKIQRIEQAINTVPVVEMRVNI